MQLHEQITGSDLPISRMFLHANMVGINKFFQIEQKRTGFTSIGIIRC